MKMLIVFFCTLLMLTARAEDLKEKIEAIKLRTEQRELIKKKIDRAIEVAEKIEDKEQRRILRDGLIAGLKIYGELLELDMTALSEVGKQNTQVILDNIEKLKVAITQPAPEIAAAIRADAIKVYPADFSMQEFRIRQQTEAWQKLSDMRQGVDGIPPATLKTLFDEALKKWGGDYDMILFSIKEQITAYKKLHPAAK